MPCYHPLQGYKSTSVNPSTGKRSITFRASEGFTDLPVTVACGRCIGCRLERSRQWALRCVHEAQLHQDNCFVTLTYNDENLPVGGTLIKKHFQDFMKRLRRKHLGKIQYFHCGEYGDLCRSCRKVSKRCDCARYEPSPGRPHYHALLFGVRFPDILPFKKSADGSALFTSAALSSLWPLGFSTVGEVTFESAAYCARYIVKKISGEPAVAHYRSVVGETGEVIDRLPEYITMSLKPAIGKNWYGEFSSDVYPDDFVVIRGKRMKPPKYYDQLHDGNAPAAHAEIKQERRRFAATQSHNATPERLAVRKKVKEAQISNLKREIE